MDPLQVIGGNESWTMRLLRGWSAQQELATLLAANMNTTADQLFPMQATALIPFRIARITASNAQGGSLSTAAGGFYTGPGKTGTIVVAATQIYSTLTGPTLALDLTIAAVPGNTYFPAGTPLFLSLTTPQGTPMTADFRVYGSLA